MTAVHPWGQWRDERSDEPADPADPADFRVAVDLLAGQLATQARLSTPVAPVAPVAAPEESPS